MQPQELYPYPILDFYEDCSTGCTVEEETVHPVLVSKSIDIKKDLPMNDVDNRPVHILFSPEIPESIQTGKLSESQKDPQRRIVYCSDWADIADRLKSKPKSMCISSRLLQKQSLIEVINMLETFTRLLGFEHKICLGLGIYKDTPYQLVREAQKLDILGIIPDSDEFGIDETNKSLDAQWSNIPYWPKHLLEHLPGAKKTTKSIPGEIHLTPRQKQILTLIKERGASNKVIARTLNITESTVKLHVGIVLKKFGVKNRTQLALFSK